MVLSSDGGEARPAWFVGAWYGEGENAGDQTPRFLEEGIWENGYPDRYLDLVKEIQPGDRIAIKKQFNRMEGIQFDNRGHKVSVMEIRATGTVKGNIGDGRLLAVDWTQVEPPREWYFYTYVKTVWKIEPGSWRNDALIRFSFDGEEQDIDSFRNAPYWKDRFGDDVPRPHQPASTNGEDSINEATGEGSGTEPPEIPEYTLQNIIDDGCFLEQAKLETILNRLRVKKNLILQGPPGTGKTWLAKKLAYALIEQRDDRRVRRFQFHPNMSYEDFVRGYRPDGGGGLTLLDGPFLKTVFDARRDQSNDYVMVIEEINRGNPAQIFGEMLTLLESDKRDPDEALALSYPKSNDERVHIPPNVYVIGTMNVADRSIALVDLALRRRFAFVDLEPVFGEVWRNWVHEQYHIPLDSLIDIERRMTALNERISADRSLGPQFRVGHSYVTPPSDTPISDPAKWFIDVVDTEIGPLLDEYWFDNTAEAESAKSDLLAGL